MMKRVSKNLGSYGDQACCTALKRVRVYAHSVDELTWLAAVL